MSISSRLADLRSTLPSGVTLIAVSKTHPVERLLEAYEAGQRAFGENRVQEILAKAGSMPRDVEWHLIGHLQRNKVRQVLPYVAMIHSVDSLALLQKIEAEAKAIGRVVQCLIQVHIATETSKFGFTPEAAHSLFSSGQLAQYNWAKIVGLMGMATLTTDHQQVSNEFARLHTLYTSILTDGLAPDSGFRHLSMGMSGDYSIALSHGSNMIRVGSLIFGSRE